MLRRHLQIAIFGLAISLLYSQQSLAKMGADLFGIGSYSMATGSPSPKSLFGLPGAGLIINFNLGTRVQLELGGMYITSRYVFNNLTINIQKASGLAGFKLLLTRILFIDAGGFMDHYMKISASVSKPNAWGVYGGLGLRVPLGRRVKLLLAGQYRYSMNTINDSSSGSSSRPSEILAIAGFNFGMM